ncbi:MAG: hypothetical protein ABJA83_09735 [Burkholderiaceae bacterium]
MRDIRLLDARLLKSRWISGASCAFKPRFNHLEFAAPTFVEQTVGPLILVFLAGVVAVGVTGAVYTVNKRKAGYGDDDAGE